MGLKAFHYSISYRRIPLGPPLLVDGEPFPYQSAAQFPFVSDILRSWARSRLTRFIP